MAAGGNRLHQFGSKGLLAVDRRSIDGMFVHTPDRTAAWCFASVDCLCPWDIGDLPLSPFVYLIYGSSVNEVLRALYLRHGSNPVIQKTMEIKVKQDGEMTIPAPQREGIQSFVLQGG